MDADPATSEGIFVFTSSAPPAAAAVGDLGQVTGTVQEFVPSTDPLQPADDRDHRPTVDRAVDGQPPAGAGRAHGRRHRPRRRGRPARALEGMRVSVDVADRRRAHARAASTSERHRDLERRLLRRRHRASRARSARRGAGPRPAAGRARRAASRASTRTPRIAVDSYGLIGARASTSPTGAVVTDVVGPLDYAYRTYTDPPRRRPRPAVAGNIARSPCADARQREFTVATANLERFFDTVERPGDQRCRPHAAAFDNRLNKVSLAIRDVMSSRTSSASRRSRT